MDKVVSQFDLTLEQTDGFAFQVKFDKDGYPALVTDEPPPLGADRGPNPARLLAVSIANCLAASLLFCLQRRKVTPASISADVHMELVRNAQSRLRVGRVAVTVKPVIDADNAALAACLEGFEEFCVVTQSVRQGIAVDVKVEPIAPATAEGQVA